MLQTTLVWILLPSYLYILYLSTCCGGWAFGSILTQLPQQTLAIHSVWEPSAVMDVHMDPSLLHYQDNISPHLGKVAKLLSQHCAEKASQLHGWGCKPLQTGSHFLLIHTHCVWTPSAVMDRHMLHTEITTSIGSNFGKTTTLLSQHYIRKASQLHGRDCKLLQTQSHFYLIYTHYLWAPSAVVDSHIEPSLHSNHNKHWPSFW